MAMWKWGALIIFLLTPAVFVTAQQAPKSPEIPANFKLDLTTAARLRPQLMSQSLPAAPRYKTGVNVLENLVAQLSGERAISSEWKIRIMEDGQFNAYSSPDGVIYVEGGLAKLAASSAGLWAAILSHELAHILHRDWARRYLFQQELNVKTGSAIVLGEPVAGSTSWVDSEAASEELARFCRQMELEADREALMLMARAGYHPDFAPALHHMLNAIGAEGTKKSTVSMHPYPEDRDRNLSQAYGEASIEFEHRWPEWYSSPGGNPPVVVFAEEPKVKKVAAHEWQISLPLRCENLAGAVEVVLRSGADGKTSVSGPLEFSEASSEVREFTGCTSPMTTVTLLYSVAEDAKKSEGNRNEVYVLDVDGVVLARADVSKGRR